MRKLLWLVACTTLFLMACSGGSSPEPAPEAVAVVGEIMEAEESTDAEAEVDAEVEETAVEEASEEMAEEETADDADSDGEEMAEEEMEEAVAEEDEAVAEEAEEAADEAVEASDADAPADEETTEADSEEVVETDDAEAVDAGSEEATAEETEAESEEAVDSEDTEEAVAEESASEEEAVVEEAGETEEATEEEATEEVAEAATEEVAGVDPNSIAGQLLQMENTAIFVQAARNSGIFDSLANPELTPITVFVPTDEAFLALGQNVVENLLGSPELLPLILRYHVASGIYMAEDVVATDAIMTDLGGELSVAVEGNFVLLGGRGVVTEVDIEASNGVIHLIDQVLEPSVDAVQAAYNEYLAEEAALGSPEVDLVSISEVIDGSADFTLLSALLADAGLTDVLANEEAQFTLFAPTDAALAQLPVETIEALGENPEELVALLSYHVLDGSFLAETVMSLDAATTLQGTDIAITLTEDGALMLNDSVGIILADIATSNGTIHVIDAVLVPSEEADAEADADSDADADAEAEAEADTADAEEDMDAKEASEEAEEDTGETEESTDDAGSEETDAEGEESEETESEGDGG